MSAAAGAAAPAAALDVLYELEPLDWVVICAALVCLVVLVRELRDVDEGAAVDEGA